VCTSVVVSSPTPRSGCLSRCLRAPRWRTSWTGVSVTGKRGGRGAGRAVRAELIRASIVEAEEREWFSPRTAWANGGVGRTRGEFLAWIIGQQEAEDARAKWAERREFEAWRRRRHEHAYADTTAPSKAEVAEQQQVVARAAEQAGAAARAGGHCAAGSSDGAVEQGT